MVFVVAAGVEVVFFAAGLVGDGAAAFDVEVFFVPTFGAAAPRLSPARGSPSTAQPAERPRADRPLVHDLAHDHLAHHFRRVRDGLGRW